MILYIAGPMTGRPEFNRPAFHAAAARLRRLGFEVLSPAELDPPERRRPPMGGANGRDPEHTDWMRVALALMLRSDGVALLPDWQQSRGARLEAEVAEACGLPCMTVDSWAATATAIAGQV